MIVSKLQEELVQAQKQRDLFRIGVLRYLLSVVKNREIELRGQQEELTDEHVLKVIKKQVKQRNDSIESYKMGNREDLVQKETQEKGILLEIFKQYSDEELQ